MFTSLGGFGTGIILGGVSGYFGIQIFNMIRAGIERSPNNGGLYSTDEGGLALAMGAGLGTAAMASVLDDSAFSTAAKLGVVTSSILASLFIGDSGPSNANKENFQPFIIGATLSFFGSYCISSITHICTPAVYAAFIGSTSTYLAFKSHSIWRARISVCCGIGGLGAYAVSPLCGFILAGGSALFIAPFMD